MSRSPGSLLIEHLNYCTHGNDTVGSLSIRNTHMFEWISGQMIATLFDPISFVSVYDNKYQM